MEPMHAAKYKDVKADNWRYPYFVQPKLDGIRCVAYDGVPRSRTWKPIPNKHVQLWFEAHKDYLQLLDGELIVGNPLAEDCYTKTMSGVMSRDGTPDFCFHVFDHANTNAPQYARFDWLDLHAVRIGQSGRTDLISHIQFVSYERVDSELEMWAYEADQFAMGWEGIILRSPDGYYKYGRATPVSQELIKMKRFVDEEATIIGFEELYSNQNEATLNAFGRTHRSSHQENKVPRNTLGAFVVRNAKGVEYKVGMGQGLDQSLRKKVWDNIEAYFGKHITVRYAATTAGYDKPRFPSFHGFRDPIDIIKE